MTTFRLEVDWGGLGSFVDETAYLRYARGWYGFAERTARVAAPGGLVAILDNGSGRFSPENEAGPLFGLLRPGCPIWLLATNEYTTWVVWAGWVTDVRPAPGEWGRGLVEVRAEDGIGRLGRVGVSVAQAESKAADEAVDEVVRAVYTPGWFVKADNGDVLSRWGVLWQPEEVSAIEVLAEVCRATYGLFYTRPGHYGYGAYLEEARYSTREKDQGYWTSASTHLDLAVVPVLAMEVGMRLDRVITRAEVMAYPRETVSASQVLWTARNVLRIAPGQTRTVYALFRDENGERCGAVDVVSPVATTDYRVFEFADGTGVEYTSSPRFSLGVEIEGTRARLTLGNTAAGPLYVTFLQVRGRAVRTYDGVSVVEQSGAAEAEYGQRRVRVASRMLSDEAHALAYAQWLIARFGSARLEVERVKLGGSLIGGRDPFDVKLLEWVGISDSESGLSEAPHRVRRIEVEVTERGATLEWLLERMGSLRYFRLNPGGGESGKLGVYTYLGF